MFVRETIERCETCSELTPHSQRSVTLARLISLAALGGAGWCLLVVPDLALIGALLLIVAARVVLHDWQQHWGIRCERCRGKKRAALRARRRRYGFRLDRNTVTGGL